MLGTKYGKVGLLGVKAAKDSGLSSMLSLYAGDEANVLVFMNVTCQKV